jgi:hypothetical protein
MYIFIVIQYAKKVWYRICITVWYLKSCGHKRLFHCCKLSIPGDADFKMKHNLILQLLRPINNSFFPPEICMFPNQN